MSRRAPDATRLVGLFRTDRDGPDALLGFAWGWWNGQSVSYFAGASARPKDLRGVFIGHPLMWDLITWAKRGGATWFDLGGVTDGTLGSADPLGGISDFKRLFSKETVDVAEDWVLEPHPMPARLAAVVSTGAARLVTRGRPAPHRSEAFTTPSGVPMLHAARRLAFQSVGSHALAPVLRQLGRGLVSIFTLHRFTDPEYDVVGHDPAALRDHLDYLRRHRYQLLSLSDALQRVDAGGDGWNTPAAVFTVDDGYSDFARIGAPIFAEFDCPVTLFVPTGFVDGQLWLWWDRVAYVFSHTRHCSCVLTLGVEQRPYRWSTPIERDRVQEDLLDRLQGVDTPQRDAAIACLADDLDVEIPASPPPAFAPVTWDDVRRLAERGVTFGPHTVTHPILPLASDDACTWEIQESYRRLREETEACVPVLCYPGGKAKLRELEVAQRAGFRAAVTTRPGYAAPLAVRGCGGLRRFALPRFAFPDDRPHLVNMVTGLARLRGRIRHPAL